MSRDMTRVREGDLTLWRGLFMERNKIDVLSLYIGWSLSAYPSDDIHRYIGEHCILNLNNIYIVCCCKQRKLTAHICSNVIITAFYNLYNLTEGYWRKSLYMAKQKQKRGSLQ